MERYKMTDETNEKIEYALANVKAAIKITSECDVLAELRSAEHHLTRSE